MASDDSLLRNLHSLPWSNHDTETMLSDVYRLLTVGEDKRRSV